jgi:hypothetical protein
MGLEILSLEETGTRRVGKRYCTKRGGMIGKSTYSGF